MIIDDWVNHQPTENKASYIFTDTSRVSIQLEYFERTGGALVNFSWSSSCTPREIVPTSQLYPIRYSDVNGSLWIDENNNSILEESDSPISGVSTLIFDASNDQLIRETSSGDNGTFKFKRVKPGKYYLHLVQNSVLDDLSPRFGTDESGFTSDFHVGYNHDVDLQFIYGRNSTTSDIPLNRFPAMVYPNPTFSNVNFRLTKPMRISSAAIIDASGNSVDIQLSNGGSIDSINLENKPPGIYILQLFAAENVFYHKIVKL